jgi:hypothetical protein
LTRRTASPAVQVAQIRSQDHQAQMQSDQQLAELSAQLAREEAQATGELKRELSDKKIAVDQIVRYGGRYFAYYHASALPHRSGWFNGLWARRGCPSRGCWVPGFGWNRYPRSQSGRGAGGGCG